MIGVAVFKLVTGSCFYFVLKVRTLLIVCHLLTYSNSWPRTTVPDFKKMCSKQWTHAYWNTVDSLDKKVLCSI